MDKSYRERIYKHYLSNIFNTGRNIQNIKKEYKDHFLYFKKNYTRFLPSDKNARILDAGCGLGHFLFAARTLGYSNIIGIDVSQELVEFCGSMDLHAVKSEITDYLQKNTEAFDAIIFNDVIEHLYKDEIINILDLFYSSLKKEGVLLVKTPNMNNPFVASAGRYIDFTHETGFTETSLKEILLVTNFNRIKIVGTDIYIFYKNPFNYLAKFFAFLFSGSLYLISWLYGRNTLKIFEKDILAIAYKK